MRLKFSLILTMGLLFGCGIRGANERGPEAPYYDIAGAWEMFTVDSRNPSVTQCRDVLDLNKDHTFTRSFKCTAQGRELNKDFFEGYYEITGDKILFNYTHAQAEIFTYFINGNEMRLVKSDQALKYYRKSLNNG